MLSGDSVFRRNICLHDVFAIHECHNVQIDITNEEDLE
jgi:hypothetical protein